MNDINQNSHGQSLPMHNSQGQSQMEQRRQSVEQYNASMDAEKCLVRNQQEIVDNENLHHARNQLAQQHPRALPQSVAVQATMPNDLPGKASSLVLASASTIGVPQEMAVACLFAAMFIAARGTFRVRVSEHHLEVVTEYLLVSAPSGQRKSSILEFFRAPFMKIQSELQAQYSKGGIANESKIIRTAIKKIETDLAKKLQHLAVKLGSVESAQANMTDDTKSLEQLRKSLRNTTGLPRLLVDMPTLEALPIEMERQGEAIGIFEAEGGFLKHCLNPRKDDILVKAYTGEAYSSDTKTLGSVYLKAPVSAICILVQPNVLDSVYQNSDLIEHGLVPRILPLLVPGRATIGNPYVPPLSAELTTWYENHICTLLKIKRPTGHDGERTFHTLALTHEAKTEFEKFSQYCRGIDANMHEDGEGGYLAYINKLPGHAVRLAGAVHLMKYSDPQNHQIDGNSMACGTAFAEFFRLHAAVAFNPEMRDGIKTAPKVLKWIQRHRRTHFAVRDAQRGIGSGLHKARQVQAGLDVLTHHGYVQGVPSSKGQLRYVVNPNVC